MENTERGQYMKSLAETAAAAKETYPEGSPAYFRRILNAISGSPYQQELFEKLLAQAVKEEDHAGLQRIFYQIAKIALLPSQGGNDHSARLWPLLDLLACADADNIYRILPEGLPLASNGYPMYIHGANILLCLLYNTRDKAVYAQDTVTAKAEKFAASKKPVWERSVVSCLLAVLNHDSARLSESLQSLCTGYNRTDAAPFRKIQCQNAYGLLMLAKRFWTAEESAAVTLPEYKNFSQGYAKWLLAQEHLPEELCVPYEAPLNEINAILKKPAAVTRIYQKYLDSDSPYLSNAEKKAWYLDADRMMEELLGAEPGTLREEAYTPENGTAPDGLSEDELKDLQRYIGHNTDELPAGQIIAHIEEINAKTPFTRENWEKLLIPACGNQNIEVLVYALERAGDIADIGPYMQHAVMGQEKRPEYLAKRIEILRKLIPCIPEKEKTKVLSETLTSAAWYGETEVVRFLIESGADMHYRDEQGKDAMEYAKAFQEKSGDDTLYRYLCSLDAKQESPRNQGTQTGTEKTKQQTGTVFGRLKNLFSRPKEK